MESSANLTAEQALTDSLLPSSSAYSGFPYLEAVIGMLLGMLIFLVKKFLFDECSVNFVHFSTNF